MAQQVVCIHHANCLDGIGAAWVVWNHYKELGIEIELIPANYTKGLPEGLEGKKVYVVDFCYDYPTTVWLLKNTDLVLLDHHDTAVRRLQNLTLNMMLESATSQSIPVSTPFLEKAEEENFKNIVLDSNYSGAMLAWRHFYGEKMPPLGIRFVEDRDLWKFQYPDTMLWTMAAFSYPFKVESFGALIDRPVSDVVNEGKVLRRKYEQDIEQISKNTRKMLFMGEEIPVINANYMFASELGSTLALDAPFVAIYSDTQDARGFSLRSSGSNGGSDVCAIAELFGGGGHKNAAGFVLKFTDKRMPKSHLTLDITLRQKVKRLFGKLS